MFLIDGLQKKFQAQPVLAGDGASQASASKPTHRPHQPSENTTVTIGHTIAYDARKIMMWNDSLHPALAIEFRTRTSERAPQAYGGGEPGG